MMMRLAARQYILMCWKNLHLLKRHYFLVPIQVLLPVGIIIILFALRQVQDVKQYKPTHFSPFPIKHEDIFFPGSQIHRDWILTAVPRHGLVLNILKNLYSRMSDVLTGPSNLMFENETTMLETYFRNDTMRNLSFATIVFSGIPDNTNKDTIVNVTYKIRFPAEQHWKYADKSNWLTDRWYDDTTYNEPRTTNFERGNINKPGYYREAFLTLQKYIDDAIIALILKQNASYAESDNPDFSIQLRMFPYPYSTYDDYVTVIKVYMPLFIVICFIVNATLIARDITLEKEKKLKESMKLMGLKPWVNWLAWFTQFFLFMLVSVVLMTMFFHIPTSRKGSVSSIFTYSHFSVTFVFLLLYAISIIMFCFMVSSIFYKANVAAATTGIIYLLSYVPYFFLQIHYNSLGYGWKIFLSFFNNLAMAFSCLQFSKLESSGIGLHWWNLGNAELSGDDLTMRTLMIMLVADILLYAILTWYLDALFPGEFGVPQPFYFPFTYWYWCGHDFAGLDDVIAAPADYDHVSNVFEKPEKNRRVGVRIRNLTKKFMNSSKPAVNNLSIDLYEGYITAFLGHNGAGKTTTMFMLTGFLEPSFGTIFINGFDVSKHLDKVRRSLGLCPQHNILFDTLTVQQHLYFFANLKGCPGDEIQAEVEKMIESLHMENKRYTPSKALSGGMKRKLSIAIALIAGSKFVMLDEPTSGMDPESRRQTWDMLQQQQHGRTIILSTHFMDEADLLGDRIAIMSEGEVKCYGTPLFLKNIYGIGYHLTMVKTQMCVAKFITELISEYIEGAKFEGEKGSELTYLLPKVESKKISKLFKAIEGSLEKLGIESFGVSITTMEEVFIKVANDAERESEMMNSGYNNDAPELTTSEAKNYENNVDLVSPSSPHAAVTSPNEYDVIKNYVFLQSCTRLYSAEHILLQLEGLLVKKGLSTLRNIGVTAFQLALPIIFAILSCIAINSQPSKVDPPPLVLDIPPPLPPTSEPRYITPYFIPPNSSPTWSFCVKLFFPNTTSHLVDLEPQFSSDGSLFNQSVEFNAVSEFLMEQSRMDLFRYKKKFMTAIQYNREEDYLTGFFQDESYHSIAVTLNKLNNLRLCNLTISHYVNVSESWPSPTTPYHQIHTINHPFPWLPTKTLVGVDTITNLVIVGSIFSNCVSFGMGLMVGTFVLFLVSERFSGAKQSQYLSGVGPWLFWLSSIIWDAVNYAVPLVAVVVTVAAFRTEAYFQNLLPVFLLLLFYFWAMLPFVYCVSLVANTPSSGYIFVTIVNIFTGTIATLALSILKYPSFKLTAVAFKIEWIFYILFPNFCLNKGLFDIYSNFQSNVICTNIDDVYGLEAVCARMRTANETNPCCQDCGDLCLYRTTNYLDINNPGIGRSLVFMVVQGAIAFLILFLSEFDIFKMVSVCLGGEMFVGGSSRHSDENQYILHYNAGSASMLTIGLSSNDSTIQKPTKEQIPNNSDRSGSSNNSSSTIIKPNNTINTNNNSSSSSQKLYRAAEYIGEQDDYDVIYERNKTLGMMSRDLLSPEPYAIVLRDVTKWYGRFLAVDGLSIAIERGECFGLLGVNGAGKTTTFKMMTGGLQCSSGDIYIKGLNIRQNPKEAQSLIGYCPQFDALIDQMTVTETLELFGKLRGIRGQELKAIVDDLIDTLVLRKHARKQAGTLSGGNKRKLGVGIALIGNPPIVFLDEPTTGMDPVARKKLWNVLAAVRQHGTTIVLTSHSMEECEALCTRIAIMVNGRFKCLGSGQHLKSKFGGGYTVVIKLKPNKKQEVLEYYTRCLMVFIDKVFPENILKDRHESLLHYQIDKPNLTWARVFEVLEKAREPFQIEDYSVGQTTLEQLFINFAKSQRVVYRDN